MNGTFPCRMFVNKLNKAEWNRVVLSILWVFPVASFFLVVIHLTKEKKTTFVYSQNNKRQKDRTVKQ